MAGDDDFVIDVRNLKKSFDGVEAVRGISIRAKRGEIFGFLGPNGSGKTTTIRMICGLLTPDDGEGMCLGYDVRSEQALIKRNVGYMTQHFSLYEDLTIRENLDFVGRMYGIPDRKKTVAGVIERMGLGDRRNQLAGELSGGWKQRLSLAASMIHNPRLLLLDEPTAGVDPQARREFWDQIHRLAAEGVTSLVSTHYMDEAERCHTLAYIAAGKLLVHGTIGEVVENSGLVTWKVGGPNLWGLTEKLTGLPGVDLVAAFGAVIHVSGYDEDLLNSTLAPFMADKSYDFQRTAPGLEDVFISLIKKAGQRNL